MKKLIFGLVCGICGSLSAETISDRFSASLDYQNRKQDEQGYAVAETSSGLLVAATTKSDRQAVVQSSPVWLFSMGRDEKGVWGAEDGYLYSAGEKNVPLYFGKSQDPEHPQNSYLALISSVDTTGLSPQKWPRYWTLVVDEKGKEIQRQIFGTLEKFNWKRGMIRGAYQTRSGGLVLYGQIDREGMKCREAVIVTLTSKKITPIVITDSAVCNAVPQSPQKGGGHETVVAVGQNVQGDLWLLVQRWETFRDNAYYTSRLERRSPDGQKLNQSIKLSSLLPPEPAPPAPVTNGSYQTPRFEYLLSSVQATKLEVDESRVVLAGTHSRSQIFSRRKSVIRNNEEPLSFFSVEDSLEKSFVASLEINDGAVRWIKRFGGCGMGETGDAEIVSLKLARQGDILLAGSCTPHKAVDPLMLSRLGSDGGILWSRQLYHRGDSQLASSAHDVIEDRKGDLVAVGTARSARVGDENVFVIKTNPDGVIE